MANPFDNVNDGTSQDDGLIEVERKRSKPNVPPKYIPSQVFPSPTEEGTFIQTAPAVSRSISPNRKTSYLINQGAGRPLKGPEVKCDYSDSPDVHSGPATHFIRLPGVSREGTEAVCGKHLRMAQERASERGDSIKVDAIEPRHIEAFKLMRRMHEQEKTAAVQIGLMQHGMSGESAQIGKAKYKTTTPKPKELSVASSSSPVDPNWDPNVDPPRGKRVDYVFPKRTTKIKTGNFQPEPNVSPELSDEEVSRLDPATRNMVEARRARGVPATGLRQYSSKGIIPMPMAFTPKPERVESAFKKIAEGDEVTLNTQAEIEAQATKQRAIEAKKTRSSEFRKQLPQ